MAQKIKIQGKSLPEITYQLDSDYNRIIKSFRLESVRGTADVIDIGAKDNDIIGLEFDDGAEWIGHIEDIHQIFGEHIRLRGDNDIFPTGIAPVSGDRGIREIGIKILHLIRGSKSIPQATAKLLAKKVDKKVMLHPGLFTVSEQGKLIQKKLAYKPSKYLLFLHGTISSFEGSFGDIYEDDAIGIHALIKEKYGNNVIALQHYTLSESPWDNAIEILKTLPKGSSLDIISHSRGGLIADILAGCDIRNQQPGYSLSEIALITKSDSTLSGALETINVLIRKKVITVDNVIRIACPARGTELLSNSLDHFLNGLLRAIGLAFGNNPVYQFIRGLITDVISARLTPDVMPGILAMVPESIPQKLINRPQVTLKNHLVVVEGDSEIGKNFWRSILVVFSNLYYREANDFVVNT
ncbi:MAG: hypothetical protein ABIR66_12360, partial [Saprospiraceae bacterium]